ncbi:unnamed protein product [Prorocentrum cordatum]|uniref:Glutaminyl-peptide cyclotransferase n=1 Tax=Prorocentrum cordatum TaxID=2364126 RepID=A0ABN9UVE0_9DINO|nr:unnamed protein product [Polarella glacialis]
MRAQELRRHPFLDGHKEGWGLTTDGCDLLATTGDSFIYRFRKNSEGILYLVNKVSVRLAGVAVRMLNELEYVTPKIWVHKWITNQVYRVDPASGEVEAYMDIGRVYRGPHRWRGDATPNGVAYSARLDPGLLLVTGKLWPQLFALRVPPEDPPGLCGGPAAALSAPACPSPPASACWPPAAAARAGGVAAARGAPALLPEWEPVPELLARAAAALGLVLAAASVALPVHLVAEAVPAPAPPAAGPCGRGRARAGPAGREAAVSVAATPPPPR